MTAMDELDLPLSETAFAVFDLETTGLNPAYGHRVCEVACLRIQNSQEIARLESLVDPERPISAGAFHVNQITPQMLADAPPFEEVAAPLLALMAGSTIVAHNAPFDLGFLAAELEMVGLLPPEGVIVDTLTLVRRLYHFASNSLPAVAAAMAINTGTAHRAMSDVETTSQVLGRILHDIENRWGATTLRELVDFQGGPIPYPYARAVPLPPTIAEALDSGGRVRMRYVNAAGQETSRTIQPLRVREDHGYQYMVAYCYLKGEQRTFRLDRIIEMTAEG
jgi:DNA polymerase-3 subunit epsilon